MQNQKQKQIQTFLQNAVQDKLFPGATASWIVNGEEHHIATGQYTYETNSPHVTRYTQYDVASITKSIPTTCLAFALSEQKRLNLEALVKTYLPEYTGDYPELLTIRHLVEFRAPFSLKLSTLKDLPAEDLLDEILSAPMLAPPGGDPAYINTTSILLTLVIEAVTEESIDSLSQTLFFEPLGMESTTFSPSIKNTAPTELDTWRKGKVQGEVHDESAWKLQEIMVPGSAGLFTTASDLLEFAKVLLNSGTYNNQQFFSAESINHMSQGLGWESGAEWMGTVPSNTFGKTGFTGCCIVINTQKQCAGVLLSNALWPQRSTDKQAELKTLRQQFSRILFE